MILYFQITYIFISTFIFNLKTQRVFEVFEDFEIIQGFRIKKKKKNVLLFYLLTILLFKLVI